MVSAKLQYFNIYRLFINLLALAIFCFLHVSCNKKDTKQNLTPKNNIKKLENAVDINTASVEELEKLPTIGAKSARNIVEHREKYGRFRRPVDLILVPGISDERFRRLQNSIKTE